MLTFRAPTRTHLGAALLLGCLAGCSQEPEWGFAFNPPYKGTHIQSLIAPQGKIRIWFDHPLPQFTVRSTGPNTGQIDPSPDDLVPGHAGGGQLPDGRVLSFRCLTQDGVTGTMAFLLDGQPIPQEEPFHLSDGRLFLVTTRGEEVKIVQLNRELVDASDAAELAEIERADPAIAEFIRGAQPKP